MRPRARGSRWRSRPAVYRVGNIRLPAGAQIVGVRGATKLLLTDGPSLVMADDADHVSLSGLSFDGGGAPCPTDAGSFIWRMHARSGSPIARS